MAAKNKTELLLSNEQEFAKLEKLIEQISDEQALLKDSNDTSIKDIIAHRAHWIDLFLGWYSDGIMGKEVHFPAKGYKWNELKRYNSVLRNQQQHLRWNEARILLKEKYIELKQFLEGLSNEDLYSGPMKGAKNHWTPGRWAEAAGPSHFRSASKYLRSRLKSKN